jgi:thiol-disulfide isomerase/thioredoxin
MNLSNILYFYTSNCAYCDEVSTHLDSLEEELDGEAVRIDVEESSDSEKLFKELAKDSCEGVPFLYHQPSGNFLCGLVSISDIKKMLEKKPD